MVFTKFLKKNSGNPIFRTGVPLPRNCGFRSEIKNSFPKKNMRSCKTERFQALISYFIREIKLKKFFKVGSGLTEKRPYPVTPESPVKTATEAPEIFRDSDESFRGGTGFPAKILFFPRQHRSFCREKHALSPRGCSDSRRSGIPDLRLRIREFLPSFL